MLGVTTESVQANIDWKSAFSPQQGQFVPEFQVEGVALTNHSSCQKTRRNVFRVRMWAQTDRQTDRKALEIPCVALQYTQSYGENGWKNFYNMTSRTRDQWHVLPYIYRVLRWRRNLTQYRRLSVAGSVQLTTATTTMLATVCVAWLCLRNIVTFHRCQII